jgi:hypothetical protein
MSPICFTYMQRSSVKSRFRLCHVIKNTFSVLTFLPSLIWATARATAGGANCWMVDDSQDQWIPDGFRIAILAINFIFLIDIIRVMALKLKRGKTSQQTRYGKNEQSTK